MLPHLDLYYISGGGNMTVTFVSGNKGKIIHVEEQFKEQNIPVVFESIDLPELEDYDVAIVANAKLDEAYEIIKEPCFVIDSVVYIDAFDG